MKTKKKVIVLLVMALFMVAMMSITAFAAGGDVAGAVEDTWIAARGQIKTVVNNVIKVATAYLDYRKHGQFEWTAPAILLGTLVFSLTCPLYIWKILGM